MLDYIDINSGDNGFREALNRAVEAERTKHGKDIRVISIIHLKESRRYRIIYEVKS